MAASAHRHCLATETEDITPSDGREQRRCSADVRRSDCRMYGCGERTQFITRDDFLMVQVTDQVLTNHDNLLP